MRRVFDQGLHPVDNTKLPAASFVQHCNWIQSVLTDDSPRPAAEGQTFAPAAAIAEPTSDSPRALLARLAADFDADEDLPRSLLRGYGRSCADAGRYARAVVGPAPVSGGDAGLPSAGDVWLIVGTGATRRNRFRFPNEHNTVLAAGFDVETDVVPPYLSMMAHLTCGS